MSDTGYEEFDERAQKSMRFMAAAQEMATRNRAALVEFFTCSRCGEKQVSCHPFCESIECGKCKHRNRSAVPRLPQPGEVTNDMLIEAIRMVRGCFPAPEPEVEQWVRRQAASGGVGAVATTMSCCEVRKALDRVEELARMMSGGHVV